MNMALAGMAKDERQASGRDFWKGVNWGKSSNERTNEYWVTQDTDGKGRLTQDTHLPVATNRILA